LKKIKYSKSLTSLRGIAVLVVLLYHSKYSLFKGGFLGVDIFFVVSGYLIGNIIFTDLNENNFSFIRFYLRRIRRLFPALLSTVIFTYFLNYFLLLPEDFTSLKESLLYIISFTGNIFFWQNNDYFSLETEILPLSHLWSLGVEEQFYLLFPVFIFFLYKFYFFRTKIKFVIFTAILLSFLYASLNFYNLPFDCSSSNCIEVTNFYWLHTRLWELLVGVLLNFFQPVRKFNSQIFLVSLLTILGSILFFNSSLKHPGLGTLPIIFGTSLYIMSSKKYDNNVISNSKILYFLGKISYSLYLIHFPLFVIRNYFDLSLKIFPYFDLLPVLLISISIALSFVSWKYIEEPFRDINKTQTDKFLKINLALIGIVLVLASPLIPLKKLNPIYENYVFDTDFQIKKDCFFEFLPEDLSKIDDCMLQKKEKKNILVIGSSLAQNIYKGFSEVNDEQYNFSYISVTGCPPFLDYKKLKIENYNTDKCENIYNYLSGELKKDIDNYSKILIIYNWSELVNEKSIFPEDSEKQILENIKLNFKEDKFLIIGQHIVFKNRLNVSILREVNFKNSIEQYNNVYLDESIFFAENIMNDISLNNKIDYFSILDLYCNKNKCIIFEDLDGKTYFVSPDNIHISDYFSKSLVKEILKFIK
jgi:peptidoglycan/LPS O-acetylase OafA/YrhL